MHTPKRQTLLGESAVLVVTVLNMMASDDHGVESSLPNPVQKVCDDRPGKNKLGSQKIQIY